MGPYLCLLLDSVRNTVAILPLSSFSWKPFARRMRKTKPNFSKVLVKDIKLECPPANSQSPVLGWVFTGLQFTERSFELQVGAKHLR